MLTKLVCTNCGYVFMKPGKKGNCPDCKKNAEFSTFVEKEVATDGRSEKKKRPESLRRLKKAAVR